MKILLLFLSFLLFNSFLSFAAVEPVVDINGDDVVKGETYYIAPAIWGAGGGGVTFGRSIGREKCPLSVVQERWDINRGHPVIFTPLNSEEAVIRVSTAVNIKFSDASDVCTASNVWKLEYDSQRGRYFIVTDGVEGNTGCESMYNWFQIEELGPIDYKLVFCPAVAVCKDVGILYDRDGTRRLSLSDTPFKVVFQNANAGLSKKNETILKSVSST